MIRWRWSCDHQIRTAFVAPPFSYGAMQTSIFCRTWDFHCQSLKKKDLIIFFKLRPFGYLAAHCSALCGVRQHDGNSVVLQVFQPRFIRLNKPAPPKVPILKECHLGKMKLWRFEHFWTYLSSLLGVITEYNSNHSQKWRQKVSKSVQLPRVSFFRSDILSKLVL